MANIATLTISRGNPRIEFVGGYGQLNRCSDIDTLLMIGNMYIDTQRNVLMQRALAESDAEWLVWIDDDIGFTVDQVRALCADTKHPVTTGVYRSFFADGHMGPVLFDWTDGDWSHVPNERLLDKKGRPLKSRLRVDACGAGFLALHRPVIERMARTYGYPVPWFDEPLVCGKKVGEDFGFCLRLAQMSIPVSVLPSVIVKHIKTLAL